MSTEISYICPKEHNIYTVTRGRPLQFYYATSVMKRKPDRKKNKNAYVHNIITTLDWCTESGLAYNFIRVACVNDCHG